MITLKTALRANAASCIIFALIFLLIPLEVSTFLGGSTPAPETVFMVLGLTLMANGLHLIWTSLRPIPHKLLVLYFSMGDFIWALASIILISLEVWVTTESGIVAAGLVALMVAALGLMQITRIKSGVKEA
jgi:hypothetical protein